MLQASHRLEEDMGTDRETTDEEQVAELLGRFGNVLIGDKLGLYQTLAEAGPLTPSERFFRPGYAANLVTSWIPALEGVRAKLEAGAQVADVGCGHGASTLIIRQSLAPDGTLLLVEPYGGEQRLRQQVAPSGVAVGASTLDFP
jgi:hypothetical protein